MSNKPSKWAVFHSFRKTYVACDGIIVACCEERADAEQIVADHNRVAELATPADSEVDEALAWARAYPAKGCEAKSDGMCRVLSAEVERLRAELRDLQPTESEDGHGCSKKSKASHGRRP